MFFLQHLTNSHRYSVRPQEGERVVPGAGAFGRRVSVTRVSSDTTVATLLIPRASTADAGTYTCSPDALPAAAIQLHLINGQ